MDFMAALVDGRAFGLRKAAVHHSEVAHIEPGIFPRTHPDISRFAPAAFAEIGGAHSCVGPVRGCPIESFTQDEAFSIAVADVWNHEPGITPALGRKSGIGQIKHGDRANSEVAVLEMDRLPQVNGCDRRIKLPRWLVRVAHREPRFVDSICVLVDPFSFLGFEGQRIGADEERGRRAALQGERGAHVVKQCVAGL